MSSNDWLKKYYGKEFDELHPEVVFDGRFKAVVKLTKTVSRAHNGVGFVLIEKNGRHATSIHKSLHEGMPSQKDMDRMQETLKKEDV